MPQGTAILRYAEIHWYSDLMPDQTPEWCRPRLLNAFVGWDIKTMRWWKLAEKALNASLNLNLAIRESTFYHMDPTDSRSFFSYTLDPHNCMRREHFKLGEILPHIRVRVQPIPISIYWVCCIHCCIAL